MKKAFEDSFSWRLLLCVERFVLVAVSVLIVISIVSSVILRYILAIDLYGIEEIITLLAIWLYFIGGSYASYKNCHISADMVSIYIRSPRIQKIQKIFVSLITLISTFILSIWSWEYMHFLWRINEKSVSLHIPMILVRAPIAICFVLSFFYAVYHLINVIIDRKPLTKDNE